MGTPHIETLSEGLKICTIPNKQVDSVTFHLRGLCGSNYETPAEIGAAHLAEHLLINSAPKARVTLEGGKIIALTSRDDVLYMVKVRKNAAPAAVKLLISIFSKNTFSSRQVTIQKKVVSQEIKRSESMPEKLVLRLANKTLFPKDRMAILNTGTIQDLSKLSRSQITSFIKRMYVPQNFVLVAAGNINHPEFRRWVTRQLKNLPEKTANNKPATPVVPRQEQSLQVVCEHSKTFTQAQLRVDFYAYTFLSTQRYAADLLADILDQRLKRKLTDLTGISYSTACYSFAAPSYGIFGFYASFDECMFTKVCRAIKNIYTEKSINTITGRELLQAKNRYLADLAFNFEKSSFRAEFFSCRLLQTTGGHSYANEVSSYSQITLTQLKQLASNLFSQQPKITVLSKGINRKYVKDQWSN